MAQMVKNLPAMQETRVRSLGWEDLLEKGKATHSSVLGWEIPWTEERGGLQFVGPQSWTGLSDSTRTFPLWKRRSWQCIGRRSPKPRSVLWQQMSLDSMPAPVWTWDLGYFSGADFLMCKKRLSRVLVRLEPARFLCPWNSPGRNTGVGCLSLLQGIFPIQGWNSGLLHCRRIIYCLSHQGSSRSPIVCINYIHACVPQNMNYARFFPLKYG